MNSQMNPGKKVFVVLSKNEAKIWKGNFDPGAEPVTIFSPQMGYEKRKLINQFFSGRNRGGINPRFGFQIMEELTGFDQIYLAGGGKGKSSAVGNFTTYLRAHNRALADRIRRVKEIDAEYMSDGELLAIAREMITHI
jgi:hypothetical protein